MTDVVNHRTKKGVLADLGLKPQAFNLQQAAALTGLSTDTFKRLCGDFGIEGRRVSKTLLLFTLTDIDILLESLPKAPMVDTQEQGAAYRTRQQQ